MKTCEEYQELVSAYIDQEASDDETAEVFLHLGACRECRTFMQSTLQLQWFMRANEPTGKAILQEQKTPIWKRKFAVPYSVAAAAVVLMFFSASLFFGQQAPPATVVNTLQKEYVYVTALPPVDVVASPLPEKKNN